MLHCKSLIYKGFLHIQKAISLQKILIISSLISIIAISIALSGCATSGTSGRPSRSERTPSEPRETRSTRANREPAEPREPRAARGNREPQEPSEPRASRSNRSGRSANTNTPEITVTPEQIDQQISNGKYQKALELIALAQTARRPLYDSQNAISLYLDKGMLEHYAGDYPTSAQSLQNAERLIEDAFTKSVTENIASYILNDNTKEYPGEDFENIYISVFNALNYYRQGRIEGALVEVRKLTLPNQKLEMLARKYEQINTKVRGSAQRSTDDAPATSAVTFTNSALARYLGVLFYQADRNIDATNIELNQLRAAFNDQPNIYKNALPTAIETIADTPADTARLDIICFTGLSPIKQENEIDIFFPFFTAPHLRNVKIKLPALVNRPNRIDRIEIKINGEKHSLELLEDISAVVTDTFNAHYENIALKTYVRTMGKYIAQEIAYAAAEKYSSKNESALLSVGKSLAFAAGKMIVDATESADIRMSRYLPSKAYIGSYTLAPGTYDIIVNYYANGNIVHTDLKQDYNVRIGNLNLMQLVNLGMTDS